MNTITKFTVIASAFRSNLSATTNLNRHEEVVNRLVMDYSMCDLKAVIGVYHEEGMPEASREVSLMIENLSWSEVKTVLVMYCNEYEQDCILVKNQENNRCALWANDWYQELGLWTQVTREEAHEAGIYTLDNHMNYWMAK